MINKLKGIAILSLGILLLAGCKDDKSDYINLSTNSYTFDAKGEETLEITIDASKSWNVDIAEEWILEKERDGNKIIIGVEPSKSNAIRSAKVNFTAGEATETFTVSQLGTNVTFAMMDNNIIMGVMSPNGKYVAGVNTAIVNNVYQYTPYYITVATGQRTEKKVIGDEGASATAIADDGLLILSDATSLNSQYFAGEDLKKFPVPPGCEQAVIEATNSDGSICVGYARHTAQAKYIPLKWVNFEYEILETPAMTLLNKEVEQGAMARGCSADGSVIYGSVWDDFAAVYWKDGKVEYVSKDKIYVHDIILNSGTGDVNWTVVDRPRLFASKDRMSPNGKYLGLEFTYFTAENKNEKATGYPAIFNIETGETFILKELPDDFTTGSALTVTDAGLMTFGCPSQGTTNGFVHNWQTGKTVTTTEFIAQEYGFSISTSEATVNKITNNGRTVLGSNILSGGSVILYWYLNVLD